MTSKQASILIIDDDAEIRYSLDRVLTTMGHITISADSGEQGIETAKKENVDLIFLDNRMDGISGIETLQHLRSSAPNSMVILMTAYGTTQTAIEAMKHGAFDYVLKPFDLQKLKELVERAIKAGIDSVSSEDTYEQILNTSDYAEGIVGSGEKMQQVLKKVGQVAASEATVMVTGESGTGKELIARCIHRHSYRADAPFHAVNCAAIPTELIESELFGHQKGSFTGANKDKTGKFEAANNGTIFLDEIGDMSLSAQAKVLRALESNSIQKVGAQKDIKINVRVVAATNKNLKDEITKGNFREDLYHRLAVILIKVPSLNSRADDIPLLVEYFSDKISKSQGINNKPFTNDAISLLKSYDWSGNIRGLRNVVERLIILGDETEITENNIKEYSNKY